MKGWVLLLLRILLMICLSCVVDVKPSLAQLTSDIIRLKSQLNLSENNHDKIDLLNKLSRMYFYKHLDSCLYYLLDAKSLAEKNGYKKGLAAAYANYAPYYSERGNLYLAYKFANDALDMYRSIGDRIGEFDVVLSISTLSMNENKEEQALSYFKQLQEISQSLKNDSLRMITHMVAAQVSAKQMSWAGIAHFIDQARVIAQRRKDTIGMLEIDINEGYLGFGLGNQPMDKSMQLVKIAVNKYNILRIPFLSAIGNLDLGNMYQKAGLNDSADTYYQKALYSANDGGYLNLRMAIIGHALHNASGKVGMEMVAANYNKLYAETGKKLDAENQKDGFSLLQATLKEKDLQIAQIHDKAKQSWILFFSSVSFCMLLFLFFLYRSYKQKKQFSIKQRILIEELELKNEVLQENNEFNKNLISIMAHDLRQPFSSIIMLDRTTAKESMQKEHYLAMIKQMRITSEKSIQVMDGLLQWMKLQLLGIGYQPSPINLLANINEAISFNADMIARKKIRIVNLVDSDIMVNAQQEMLLFINRNLINNAVKFSSQNGEISIKAKKTLHEIQLSIYDAGAGIPHNELANLFKNPKRNGTGTPTVKGAGIALFICKDMIAKMNGKIWAENNPDGKGAIFTYSLSVPLEKASLNPLLEINGPGSLN